MALKSTIFKATLAVADIDHGYYADHALTLARHPSETDERMMIRLVALALNAHQLQDVCNGDGTLAFGAGLSNVDEPDVWLRDFTGEVKIWIEVGQPEDKPIIKACGKADEVIVYCFNHAADLDPDLHLAGEVAQPHIGLVDVRQAGAEGQRAVAVADVLQLVRVQRERDQPDHHPLVGFARVARQRQRMVGVVAVVDVGHRESGLEDGGLECHQMRLASSAALPT